MNLMKLALATAAVVLTATSASAQGFPNKPIRIIVPFTPGSSTDITARAVADKMTQALGQPVLVENRAGAGGRVGSDAVAKSAPDGYTLLVNSSAHTVNPAIYTDMPFDTAADFAGVTPLANLPNVLIIAPSKNIKTVADLVTYAKGGAGKLNFASAGVGSATHMNAEKFSARAGITHTHVPFRGTPEAVTDVIAGRVDVYFCPLNAALSHIQAGTVLALAVGTAQRAPILPNVPTTIEAGVRDSDYNFWVGMLAPGKTPRDVITKLNQEVVKILNSADMKEKFASLGAAPMPMAPAQFDAYIKAELPTIAAIVKAANIKPN